MLDQPKSFIAGRISSDVGMYMHFNFICIHVPTLIYMYMMYSDNHFPRISTSSRSVPLRRNRIAVLSIARSYEVYWKKFEVTKLWLDFCLSIISKVSRLFTFLAKHIPKGRPRIQLKLTFTMLCSMNSSALRLRDSDHDSKQ